MPWLRLMGEVDALEAAGDAAAALRAMEAEPLGPDGRPWWRPSRVRRLAQLEMLGRDAPAWTWGRWIVAQAAQSAPRLPRRALDLAVETRGGRGTLWGVDEADAMAKVMDHDWVYRQLVVHEHGGLATFLRDVAAPGLVEGCADVRGWVGVPMGGYELLGETADAVLWWDLGRRCPVTTLNMGGAAMLHLGECVIGRVVELDGVSLFESAPLCVPDEVARAVAAAPADWLAEVAAGCRGPLGEFFAELIGKAHDFDLLFDLPARLRRQLVGPADLELRADGLAIGGNGADYDTALVLAAVTGGIDVAGEGADGCGCDGDGCGVEDRRPLGPLIGAALLEPGVSDALEPLLVPADARALRQLAFLLPPPAAGVCREIGERLRAREGV